MGGSSQHQPTSCLLENVDGWVCFNEVTNVFGTASRGTSPIETPIAKALPTKSPPAGALVNDPSIEVDDQEPQDSQENEDFGESADREGVCSVRAQGVECEDGDDGSKLGEGRGRPAWRERMEGMKGEDEQQSDDATDDDSRALIKMTIGNIPKLQQKL